jgi:mannose-6-phosphate isomerase-like protein (cupin superfamily)
VETLRLEEASVVTAPDGSTVLPLLSYPSGSLAHCTLPAGGVSAAVRHRVVQEIWHVTGGSGEVWRRDPSSGQEVLEAVGPGVTLTIPEGIVFQFRTVGSEPLVFLCFTMPAWPGEHVAEVVTGKWQPNR